MNDGLNENTISMELEQYLLSGIFLGICWRSELMSNP